MKMQLHIAGWIARRIEKRSRAARRALRDHQRQEWSQIKRDERRARGLRLYIAWVQTATNDRRRGGHRAESAAAIQVGIPQLAR